MVMETPCLPSCMFYVPETSDACVFAPHFAAPKGADVEYMIVGELNHAAVTNGDHGFPLMLLDQIFEK